MQKLQHWIGIPVLEMKNGGQLGEVQQVVINFAQDCVLGILLANDSWGLEKPGILFQDIFGLGRDALTVVAASVIREMAGFFDSAARGTLGEICGKQVYTDCGDFLGKLTDVVCNPATGAIKCYELSDSFITDILYGRLQMPLPQSMATGENKIIVPAAISKLLRTNQEPGGV